jgi:hypothetical protein
MRIPKIQQVSFHIRILILTLVLLVGGLTSYTLIRNGYFPVARVNSKFVSYKTIKENVEVSRRIYKQGQAGASEELDNLFSPRNYRELEKKSLESLIINMVVKDSATKESLAKVDYEISTNFKNSANTANSVKTIYGWDMATFKKKILEPQALWNILRSEKGSGFEEWLRAEKNEASVKIMFLPFKWEEGELKIK